MQASRHGDVRQCCTGCWCCRFRIDTLWQGRRAAFSGVDARTRERERESYVNVPRNDRSCAVIWLFCVTAKCESFVSEFSGARKKRPLVVMHMH